LITESPNMVILLTLVFFCTEFIAISIGVVTNLSISSALLPFHSVTIIICVLVTSGNASMDIFLKETNPAITKIVTQKKVNGLFLIENEIMLLMILFIFLKENYDGLFFSSS